MQHNIHLILSHWHFEKKSPQKINQFFKDMFN